MSCSAMYVPCQDTQGLEGVEGPEGLEGWRSCFLVEAVLSRVLDEEGLLQWAHHSSSVLPHTPLILIIDKSQENQVQSSKWELFGKRVQQVECIAKDFQIIYIGRAFNALPSELAVRILAHTPPNSHTSSFCHKLFSHFQTRECISIFSSTDGFSEWEDISYILDEVKFLTKTPRESNIELLRALLVTEETDYLLLNKNQQLKVADLEGKMILLLIASLDAPEMMRISALKDVYLKMHESHKSVFEVVWTPCVWSGNTWEEYERAAANAPWPMLPNPWSISSQLKDLIRQKYRTTVVVVDGKGRICREDEDAMAMIERWGVEAYPFSESHEEELRKAEWEGFKVNSQSALEFVFQNVELFTTKAKEAMVCVGSAGKMMEFVPGFLTMLESDIQVFYVGNTSTCSDYYEHAYEKKTKEICIAASLSFSDVYKFWRRLEYLYNDLNGMGMDEKIVEVRKLVFGLDCADYDSKENEMGISIVVVDEKGKMISGRGMEVVKLICLGDEDNKKKLLIDIKNEGLQKTVERRWRDGTTFTDDVDKWKWEENACIIGEEELECLQEGAPLKGKGTGISFHDPILFSYEGLKPSAQETFLDICSFFCDWKWEEVACIVGEEELKCLQKGALLERKGERISIPENILEIGRNKSKHNRFTSAETLCITLKNEELVSQIKGIWLQSNYRPFRISAQELDVMSLSLRVLAMGDLTTVEGKCSKQFDKLMFLQVRGVPNLPIDISNLKHLTYIDYGFGKDMILSSSKNLSSLKVLKFNKFNDSRIVGITEFAHIHEIRQLVLRGCYATEILQSFSKLHKLQKLELSACPDLTELPEVICKLKYLQELDLSSCKKLKRLPAGFGELGTLTILNLWWCENLQELPCDFEKLSSLQSMDLSYCSSLLGLPERLGNLTSLIYLGLTGCKSLSCLPRSIGDLRSFWASRVEVEFNGCSSLRELPDEIFKYAMPTSISLTSCSSLKMLPKSVGQLQQLETFVVAGRPNTSLKALPEEFCQLQSLKRLTLRWCMALTSLPTHFASLTKLQHLELAYCYELKELPLSFKHLLKLQHLDLQGCINLEIPPHFLGKITSLQHLNFQDCRKLKELPNQVPCQKDLRSLNLVGTSIEELPSEVGLLINMENLEIGSPFLKSLPASLGFLTNLRTLKIECCTSLTRLPDSLGLLPNLSINAPQALKEAVDENIELGNQSEPKMWQLTA